MKYEKQAKVFGLATGTLIIDEDGKRVLNRKLFIEADETVSNYKRRVRDSYGKRRTTRAVR